MLWSKEFLVWFQDAEDAMVDLREYDVPFHVRFAIDNDIRAGHWYNVAAQVSSAKLLRATLLSLVSLPACDIG